MLTDAEIAAFVRDGYLPLRGAVAGDVVAECRSVLWSQLAERGVLRDDPATWQAPVVRLDCPEGGPFAAAGTSPRLLAAFDDLIGPGRWWRREGVGGTIPVRFPSEADPGDAGWHIEGSYPAGGRSFVNVRSRARGLLAIYLLTDVDAVSAPTRVRPGSHLDVPPLLAEAGEHGMDWMKASLLAAEASAHRPTELATGQAGDVFLCHPFLVHAASWPHRGREPRMIAQPGVALLEEYPLQPAHGGTVPPVEQAILQGLARPAAGE
ncbi:MAG: phytanoyl-CoA dioxygenase family protein [Actinobacteria bacterium]|nr:phytanoyl-CoA dioxygenase family protein [Actinomycetota bacterium]